MSEGRKCTDLIKEVRASMSSKGEGMGVHAVLKTKLHGTLQVTNEQGLSYKALIVALLHLHLQTHWY